MWIWGICRISKKKGNISANISLVGNFLSNDTAEIDEEQTLGHFYIEINAPGIIEDVNIKAELYFTSEINAWGAVTKRLD